MLLTKITYLQISPYLEHTKYRFLNTTSNKNNDTSISLLKIYILEKKQKCGQIDLGEIVVSS